MSTASTTRTSVRGRLRVLIAGAVVPAALTAPAAEASVPAPMGVRAPELTRLGTDGSPTTGPRAGSSARRRTPIPAFLLDKGRHTTFDAPDARQETETVASGTNDRGQIVGVYEAVGSTACELWFGPSSLLVRTLARNWFASLRKGFPMTSLRSTPIRRRWRAVIAASLMLAALAVTAPAAGAAPQLTRAHGVGFGGVPALDDSRADLGPQALADTTARGYLLRKDAFTPLRDVPGASLTGHLGVNDRGQIVGFYVDAGGKYHGFLLDKGVFTTIDVPGADGGTAAFDIDNRGQIVGNYVDAGGRQHAFLLDRGVFTTINAPGATLTAVTKINDRGQIAGGYLDVNGRGHGYLLDKGVFTTIDVPGATTTTVSSVNDRGQALGVYEDGAGTLHGYLLRKGAFTTIDAPDAGSETVPLGINNRGDTVGGYADATRTTHGFLLRNGVFTTLDASGAPSGTVATDINDRGDILIPAPGAVQLNV
jgi:hypothetical protein